ncbi:MAG: hypothetical protein WA885_20840 [Phormidesmis sp.]
MEPKSYQEYIVGVMTMDVEGKDSERFLDCVTRAVSKFERTIANLLRVRVDTLSFEGPHLLPTAGAYAPLDFLRIGITEKTERDVHFLLIITEVDLSSTSFASTLALPSQITNVGIISTKRLNPTFWGNLDDRSLTIQRLEILLLHIFGHLLNLSYSQQSKNIMYDFVGIEELADMVLLTDQQKQKMRKALPREAHERISRKSRWRFVLQTLGRDWKSIAIAIIRANPFRLLARLPTMITAALSTIIFLFFTPDMWDVASTVELYQLILFSVIAVAAATAALYRAFAFGSVLSRNRRLAESTVVTSAATVLSLLFTMTLLFAIFMGLIYTGTVTIFPRKLMETWPTVDPAVRTIDHIKLSIFVAALGVLAGSLGGRADSEGLIRGVLFVDEEA